MRSELEKRLVERWPQWFKVDGDFRHTAMTRGFTHDDGWFDILWRLCEDLEPLVAEFEVAGGPKFEVLQVKEKFGGLRFYVNCRRNDAIRQCIVTAMQESFQTLRNLRAAGQTAGRTLDQDFVRPACQRRRSWLSYHTIPQAGWQGNTSGYSVGQFEQTKFNSVSNKDQTQ